MLPKQLRTIALPFLFVYIVVAGCTEDDNDDNDNNDKTDASEAGNNSSQNSGVIEVTDGDASESVPLADLSTEEIDGIEVVLISAILKASELDIDLNEVLIDFEGSDGYRPSTKDSCKDFLPTSGEHMTKVGVNLDDENTLVWDSDLDIPKCAAVKDVAIVHIVQKETDLSDDAGETNDDVNMSDAGEESDAGLDAATDQGVSLDIIYNGHTESVTIDDLETGTLDDTEVVLVSTIIDVSGFQVSLSNITIDFVGSDGYRPSENPRCSDFVPMDGDNAELVGVDLNSENTVTWDSSLEVGGCAQVGDLTTIYLEDK